jgi:hypothetical protein
MGASADVNCQSNLTTAALRSCSHFVNFSPESRHVRNSPIQTLPSQDAQFHLGYPSIHPRIFRERAVFWAHY